MRALELIEEAYNRKGGVNGIATGFHDFDKIDGAEYRPMDGMRLQFGIRFESIAQEPRRVVPYPLRDMP